MIILITCVIGAYSVNESVFDIGVMISFGLLGYLMRKKGFPAAPLLLAMILCPLLERNVKRSFLTSGGSFSIFLDRPISAALLVIAGLLVLTPAAKWLWKRRSLETNEI